MREQGGDAVVWRVDPRLKVWAGVFGTLAALGALSAWLAWLFDRSGERAAHPAVVTALVAVVLLVGKLLVLRPRVELRGETVVIVNPLATHRLRREDIVAVTDGMHGALFHRRDGFRTLAVALGGASAGFQDERLAEVRTSLGL